MHSKDLIKKIYSELPPEIEGVIASENTLNIFEEISGGNNLDYKQKGILVYETTMKIVGLSTGNFENTLKDKLQVTDVVAKNINSEIESKIFSLIPNETLVKQQARAQVLNNESDSNVVATKPELVEKSDLESRKNVVSIPNYSNYDSGKDPYREPIE